MIAQASVRMALIYKKPKIIADSRELLELAPARISFAMRPRDKVYLSDALAIASAVKYLNDNPKSQLRVDIADLDFDLQRGAFFVPYSKNPNSLRTIKEILDLFAELVSEDITLNGRISINVLSQWMRDPDFMEFLVRCFSDPNISRAIKLAISGKRGKPYKVPFSPICPSCDHASCAFAVLSPDKQILSNVCKNPACKDHGKLFSRNVREPGAFCVFYFLDNAGDAFNLQGFGLTDVHFTALDPSRLWGMRRLSIAQINATLLHALSEGQAQTAYYKSPRVADIYAKKLSFNDFVRRTGLDHLGNFCLLMAAISEFHRTEPTKTDFTMADLLR